MDQIINLAKINGPPIIVLAEEPNEDLKMAVGKLFDLDIAKAANHHVAPSIHERHNFNGIYIRNLCS